MIIVFQGTQEGKHGTAAAMVAAASFQMARSNKKIAILSFCDNEKKNNIENFAFTTDDIPDIGNPLAELGDFEFSDAGIDALIRRSETGILTKEHFNTCSMPAVKAQNGLDIVGTTNAENFEDDMTLRFDVAKKVLNVAEELYDYIFVLADPQHAELVSKLDEVADRVVVVVRQGKADPSFAFPNEIKNKVSVLVADYEPESSFGIRYLKNSYKVKQVFVMPHSVTYRDACTNGSLVRFALRNAALSETPGDINYAFSSAMKALLDHVCGKAEEEEEQEPADDDLQPEVKPKKKRARKMHEVPPDSVKPETVATKKKLFKKQETYDRIVIGKDHLDPEEQIVDADTADKRRERDDYVLNESPITHGGQDASENADAVSENIAKQEETEEESSDPENCVVEKENPSEEDPELSESEAVLDTGSDETDSQNENVNVTETESLCGPAEDVQECSDSCSVEADESVMESTADASEDNTAAEGAEDTDENTAPSECTVQADTEDDIQATENSGDNAMDIFSAPEEIPSDEPDVPEQEEHDFLSDSVSDQCKAEAAEDLPQKKKKGLFSFLHKNRTKVYEADFNGLKAPSVDAIEEEIRESMKDTGIDENAAQSAAAEPSEEKDTFYDDDSTDDVPAVETEETERSFSSLFADDDDELAEVPVSDGAPRKLSRREKRMLREAIHEAQPASNE